MGKLFEPIALRGVDIPNRIVMPSMTTRLATPEGAVTPELIRYYVARGRALRSLLTKRAVKRLLHEGLRRPNVGLERRLRALGLEVHRIGDCQPAGPDAGGDA